MGFPGDFWSCVTEGTRGRHLIIKYVLMSLVRQFMTRHVILHHRGTFEVTLICSAHCPHHNMVGHCTTDVLHDNNALEVNKDLRLKDLLGRLLRVALRQSCA